jgi:hypothetical protein
VFVALGIHHAMPMHHAVVCGLSSSYNICPRYLINGKVFGKKKVIEQKAFVFILSITTFV